MAEASDPGEVGFDRIKTIGQRQGSREARVLDAEAGLGGNLARVLELVGSGDVAFELCYLHDMPAVLRALAGAENSIEKCGSSSTRPKHPEGSFKVVNALAMAASYDPDPTESLGIRLPVDLRHLRGLISARRAQPIPSGWRSSPLSGPQSNRGPKHGIP